MLKFLIADDHEIVRRGLKQIILEEFSFATVEEAGDTQTLIAKALEGDWNIVISDLAMPGGGGLEGLRKIKEKLPQLPVLILSIYPADQYAVRVIKQEQQDTSIRTQPPMNLSKLFSIFFPAKDIFQSR
jgi:DNA-binding NarL/FixJ family response regulator